jgi:hypothetical protein
MLTRYAHVFICPAIHCYAYVDEKAPYVTHAYCMYKYNIVFISPRSIRSSEFAKNALENLYSDTNYTSPVLLFRLFLNSKGSE